MFYHIFQRVPILINFLQGEVQCPIGLACFLYLYSSDEQLIVVVVMSDMPELIHGKQSRVERQL